MAQIENDIRDINVSGNNNTLNFGVMNSISHHNRYTASIESLTGTEKSLRGRLKAGEQKYIDMDDKSLVKEQLAKLIVDAKQPNPDSKPLIIKGYGGLGKTRLALEICRYAQQHFNAKTLLLTSSNIDSASLENLIQQFKQQKQHLILLIDYLEYFTKLNQDGYFFDSLRQNLHDSGEGWVHLVLTTRYLPNQTGFPRNGLSSYERLGAETLTATYCHILDLTAKTYQEWRIKVCETIYTRSKEQNIDNPLIATLLNYWKQRETTLSLPNTEELRQDNGWLLRHLCHEFRSELHNTNDNGEYKLTYLLLLFPFHQEVYSQIQEKHPHLQKWLDALERTGLVHCHEQDDDNKWELGHDLLADIAFSELLLKYAIPRQRNELVRKLLTDAQEIGHDVVMIIGLFRALEHKSRLNHDLGDIEQENDMNILKIVWEQFSKNTYDEIRLQVAKAAFNYAWAKHYQEENNIDAYLIIWERFSKDTHNEIRLQAAKAAFNYALGKQVALKNYPFTKPQKLKQKENDFNNIYLVIWNQFGNDAYDEIRSIAAKAAFNYTVGKHRQKNDITFYLPIWAQFGKDSNDEVRLPAVFAAWNYAMGKHQQKNDITFYLPIWEQFGKDTHDEIRLQAANAACIYACEKAKQENDINFYPIVWEQFKNDTYLPIQKQALSAKLEYISWQIALGQAETAYQDGLALLNHPLLDKNNNAALHFLLWLAQPTPETQQACDNAVASLNGEATTWEFDEFAERIASFSDENQAYAKRIIQLLEQGNK